jgi:hypothetical protein
MTYTISKIAWDPKTESTKSQIPNNKLVSSGTTALNSVSVIEYWDLGFIRLRLNTL